MAEPNYSMKSMGELIRTVEAKLKQLKIINKKIEDLLKVIEHEQNEKKHKEL